MRNSARYRESLVEYCRNNTAQKPQRHVGDNIAYRKRTERHVNPYFSAVKSQFYSGEVDGYHHCYYKKGEANHVEEGGRLFQIRLNIFQMFFICFRAVDGAGAIVEIVKAFGFFGMQNGADGFEAGVRDGMGREAFI